MQIKLLEQELGVPLFNRLGRRVELTSAGNRFLEYSQRLIDLAEHAKAAVAAKAEPSGILNISAPETLLIYRLPALLKQYQSRFPAVQININSASSCVPGNRLDDDTDIAFTLARSIPEKHLISQRLTDDKVHLFVSKEHHLAAEKTISVRQLLQEQFLLTDSNCAYRNLFDRAISIARFRPTGILTFQSVEAIKQCTLARMGIGLLPASVAFPEHKAGKLKVLPWPRPGKELRISTFLFRHKDKWVFPAMDAFWTMAATLVAATPDLL